MKEVFFGLSKGKRLAKEIAKLLGKPLGVVDTVKFKDSEIMVTPETSVRGKDVYVCQSTSQPVNESVMELLIFLDALKRASANTINVIMPYYGYARQDRKTGGRQPITASLVAKLLQTAGASRIITYDLHSQQTQGFFDIPVDHLYVGAVLSNAVAKTMSAEDLRNVVVVSPDHGGVVRARRIAEIFSAPIAIMDKRRVAMNKVERVRVLGDVKGKVALVVDDMIDTGGTIIKAAELLHNKGAKEVIIAATHPVFSGDCLERLQESSASKIFVANTINVRGYDKYSKLHMVSIAPFIAETIEALIASESISTVYKKYSNARF